MMSSKIINLAKIKIKNIINWLTPYILHCITFKFLFTNCNVLDKSIHLSTYVAVSRSTLYFYILPQILISLENYLNLNFGIFIHDAYLYYFYYLIYNKIS